MGEGQKVGKLFPSNLYDSQTFASLLQILGDKVWHRAGRKRPFSLLDHEIPLCSDNPRAAELGSARSHCGLGTVSAAVLMAVTALMLSKWPPGKQTWGARAGEKEPGGSVWLWQWVCKHESHPLGDAQK